MLVLGLVFKAKILVLGNVRPCP